MARLTGHRILLISMMLIVTAQDNVLGQGPADSSPSPQRWIDLTHSFDKHTIYWPTAGSFQLSVDEFGETPKGYFYASNSFAASEHGGTHLDAPIHFAKQGKTVAELPLDRLIGEAVVIDVSEKCKRNPDYQIGVGDLHDWETKHKRQLIDVIVLIRTGYSKRWTDRKAYLGTDETGPEAVAKLHFPGLDPIAAKWLVDHRMIKAIGIDTASIDYGQSTRFQSHVTLFKNSIPAFENVAELDQLPEQGATVIALPMKIAVGTGAPLRIIATIPN